MSSGSGASKSSGTACGQPVRPGRRAARGHAPQFGHGATVPLHDDVLAGRHPVNQRGGVPSRFLDGDRAHGNI